MFTKLISLALASLAVVSVTASPVKLEERTLCLVTGCRESVLRMPSDRFSICMQLALNSASLNALYGAVTTTASLATRSGTANAFVSRAKAVL